jgi:uncharacterized protein (TIGR02597 family)
MRRLYPLLVAVGFLSSVGLAFAQTVTTNPVGFISTNVAGGHNAALSFPLDNLPAFTAAATAVTATTIQTTNAGWTANQFGPPSSNPFVVRMLSGNLKGRHFIIASNTTDTLTISGSPNLTGAAAGDQYEICKVNTLGSVFGTANANLVQFGPNASTDKLKTNASQTVADNVLLNNGLGWSTFWNTGSQWQQVGQNPPANRNNTAILPEKGFLFVRHDSNALPAFTNTGAVPTTDLITDLPANKNTFMGIRFPINMRLSTVAANPPNPAQPGLDLDKQAGWKSNDDPNQADQVLRNNGLGWLTYWHTTTVGGGRWQQVGQNPPALANPTFAAGSSILIVRRAGTDIVYKQTLPYQLN